MESLIQICSACFRFDSCDFISNKLNCLNGFTKILFLSSLQQFYGLINTGLPIIFKMIIDNFPNLQLYPHQVKVVIGIKFSPFC